MGIDILGIDIMGVDILGIDIPAPTLSFHACLVNIQNYATRCRGQLNALC